MKVLGPVCESPLHSHLGALKKPRDSGVGLIRS